MSDLKRIRVREAKLRDLGLFRKLWTRLLEQQVKEGSIVLPNEKTMNLYESLFDSYTEKNLEGIVLFVADKGVLMWGESASPLDCGNKLIMNWGCYVDLESDDSIKEALWNYALEWAKKHEFKGVLTETYKDSKPLKDFETVSTLVYQALDKKE